MNMKLPPYLQGEIEDYAPHPHQEVDFSEYEWMAEELEEFDRQIEEEFWEEAFIEACFEEMLQEEEAAELAVYCSYQPADSPQNKPFSSKLNPDAPEFVPRNLKKGKA